MSACGSCGWRSPRPRGSKPTDHVVPDAHNGRMDLAGKLQIKPGTVVCAVGAPADGPDLTGAGLAGPARDAGAAYPKAGQLGTDLNRDRLAAALEGQGIRPVRQVALDDVWSALRFRPA